MGKPGNSLYFAKIILVSPFRETYGVKHCFSKGYFNDITELRQTKNTYEQP